VLLENIPEFATDKYIKEWIEENASIPLEQITIQKHTVTAKISGTAVIHFTNSLSAQSAVCKLDQKKCLGNTISVKLLKSEEDKPNHEMQDPVIEPQKGMDEPQIVQDNNIEKSKKTKIDSNEAKSSDKHKKEAKDVSMFLII
jgi:hypothetical protein